MDKKQIENLYRINGVTDYRLKGIEDLLRCHGIDFKQVDGYARLDDINKAVYEKFIVNIFNALGLESRSELVPKGIYYVEETDYLFKENPEDDYYTVIGGIVKIIDRNGMMSVLRTWNDEDYKDVEPSMSESRNYLRFEYEHGKHEDGGPRKEWLHVIKDGKEWY